MMLPDFLEVAGSLCFVLKMTSIWTEVSPIRFVSIVVLPKNLLDLQAFSGIDTAHGISHSNVLKLINKVF